MSLPRNSCSGWHSPRMVSNSGTGLIIVSLPHFRPHVQIRLSHPRRALPGCFNRGRIAFMGCSTGSFELQGCRLGSRLGDRLSGRRTSTGCCHRFDNRSDQAGRLAMDTCSLLTNSLYACPGWYRYRWNIITAPVIQENRRLTPAPGDDDRSTSARGFKTPSLAAVEMVCQLRALRSVLVRAVDRHRQAAHPARRGSC